MSETQGIPSPVPPPETQPDSIQELQQRLASHTEQEQQERPFSVEVQQPETWFDTFKQIQAGELPKRGFTLGKIEPQDALSSDIKCAVRVVGREKDDNVTTSLTGQIGYSETRVEKDGGFNTTGQIMRIAKDLREKGIIVKFNTSPLGGQGMILDKDGVICNVNLGYASAKEMSQSPMGGDNIRAYRDTLVRKEGFEPTWRNPYPETKPVNGPIHFYLTNESKQEDVIQIPNSERLTTQVTGFSKMFGEFVNAYYKVHDTKQPEALSLKIPDWDTYAGEDDNLANVRAREESDKGFGRFHTKASIQEDIGYMLTPQERAAMPTLAEIGGQPQAVAEARKLVMSIKHADVYARRGVDRPKGILLEGPPGTGKTMLARAIAHEAGAEFMSLSVTDLVSKWFGEAEQNVQKFFDRAKVIIEQGKDLIVFIDEIDSVVPDREGAHEGTKKMVAVFLQNMDGLMKQNKLTFLAATNRRESMDPAFLRPGRLDKKISVGLPDATGIQQILAIHLKKHMERAAEPNTIVDPQIDIGNIANLLGSVSGADIAAIVNLALEEKTTAEIKHLEGAEGGRPWSPLTADELLRAKEMYFPSAKTKGKIGFHTPLPL